MAEKIGSVAYLVDKYAYAVAYRSIFVDSDIYDVEVSDGYLTTLLRHLFCEPPLQFA